MEPKKTISEFKEFIAKGNVMDMAVGVIIGGAFGKIVTSLVNDILMPIVGINWRLRFYRVKTSSGECNNYIWKLHSKCCGFLDCSSMYFCDVEIFSSF